MGRGVEDVKKNSMFFPFRLASDLAPAKSSAFSSAPRLHPPESQPSSCVSSSTTPNDIFGAPVSRPSSPFPRISTTLNASN